MSNKKKILFIDRDGTLINEAPPTYQLDSFAKLVFYPGMFRYMRLIASRLDYELVMVTNQDGLGTPAFPEETFWPVHNLVMQSLEGEDIRFSKVFIDKTYPSEKAPTRKPGTGMLLEYIGNEAYDLAGSFVIGDRLTDMQLAKNLGCKGIWLNNDPNLLDDTRDALQQDTIVLETRQWSGIWGYLERIERSVTHHRYTNETRIDIQLSIDGSGKSAIHTGIGFFDHMLEQLARHGGIDLTLTTAGDLHIDEHHSIEDTGIALGEAFALALGDKKGIARYGFLLPMDDCLAQVAVDFGGRNWLNWDAAFTRESIGGMPTEMFKHFFKSFADGARCNLDISARGENEHHKIEAIFKAWARAIRMAVKKDWDNDDLPTTKGQL